MAQKFVLVVDKGDYKKSLTDDSDELVAELRLGDVCYHKDLVYDNEVCLGGGLYEKDGTSIILHGESYDFGMPQWDRVTNIRTEYFINETLCNIKYKYPSRYPYNEMKDVDVTQLLEF